MAQTVIQTPYATAMPFVVNMLSSYTDEYDAQRLASYDLYDDLYNNDPSTYRMMLRGTDEKPIYIPTAKRIINTLARYVGKGWGYSVSSTMGTSSEQEEAKLALSNLFKRERLLSLFAAGKKEWLRRGDWIWFITGDLLKEEGKRISVRCIDPRMYFPIPDATDLSRIAGAELIEETVVNGDVLALKVQRYLKANHPEHPSFGLPVTDTTFIYYDVAVYELDGYSVIENRKMIQQTTPLTELVGITAMPVYHIRNNESTDDPFGRSDLSGLETIVAGVNQAVSDEDLSLAMSGLGMYWTDSGAPVNETTGQPENWKLGPNRVVEVGQGNKFNRVDGINTVQPFQDHIKYLEDNAFGTSGISDVAMGTADGSVVVSGIALAIRMQPLFDEVDSKDANINSAMTQMFYDLKQWFDVYEGLNFGEVEIISTISKGERLPFDRVARWTELLEGYTAGLFSLDYVQSVLVDEFGYEFPAGMLASTQEDQQRKAALADPYAARVSQELATGTAPVDGAVVDPNAA